MDDKNRGLSRPGSIRRLSLVVGFSSFGLPGGLYILKLKSNRWPQRHGDTEKPDLCVSVPNMKKLQTRKSQQLHPVNPVILSKKESCQSCNCNCNLVETILSSCRIT